MDQYVDVSLAMREFLTDAAIRFTQLDVEELRRHLPKYLQENFWRAGDWKRANEFVHYYYYINPMEGVPFGSDRARQLIAERQTIQRLPFYLKPYIRGDHRL